MQALSMAMDPNWLSVRRLRSPYGLNQRGSGTCQQKSSRNKGLPHAHGRRSLLSPAETLADHRAAERVAAGKRRGSWKPKDVPAKTLTGRGLDHAGFSEAAWDSRAGNGEKSARPLCCI